MNFIWLVVSVILAIFIILISIGKLVIPKFKEGSLIILSVILGLTIPKVYEKETIDDIKYHLPKLRAENLLFDMENDSIHLKFNLKNDDYIPAKNIRYITIFEDNIFLSPDVQEELSFGSEIMLYGFVGFEDFLKKSKYSVDLYVIYDIQIKNKIESYYIQYNFYLPSYSGKIQTINPVKSSKPLKINNFQELISKIFKKNNLISRKEGTFFCWFDVKDLPAGSEFIFFADNEKKFIYNPIDSNVYFYSPLNGEIGVYISQRISYTKALHCASVTWNDNSARLFVDDQGFVNDSTIRQIYKSNPSAVYRDVGITHFNLGDYSNAITYLNKSLQLDSINEFITYEKLFLSYEESNQVNKGIDVLSRAITRGHSDSSILINLAIACEKTSDTLNAIKYYKMDNKLNESLTGYLNYSLLLINLRKGKEAEELLDIAINKYPFSSGLYNNYGVVNLGFNRKSQAYKYFRKAVDLDSTNINAKNNLNRLSEFYYN